MISFFLFSLFVEQIFCRESYERSIFGFPGTDEVHNEFVDGLEILQTGLPRPKLNPVRNGNYSSSPINESDYPWPGHNYRGTCTPELLMEEAYAIDRKYVRTDLTQEEVHWHPAGAAQWYTTQEELDKADRVKIRYTFQRKHEHFLPAFVPPGELVTIEIPNIVAERNELGITLNVQTRESSSALSNRLPRLILRNIRLRKNVSHIAMPYGATINFHYGNDDPIDIIVSGVILQPYFTYGVHSDEEWENKLSKLPGPYAFLDTGNLVHMVPAKFVRSAYRMNDCMHYWRSAIQIAQTTARDVSQNNNPRFGRMIHPCVMKYDTFVPAGAAVAYPAGNFCHFPCDWISSTVRFEASTDNPWGTMHEIDHHHQENWARTQEAGEMSNNAVNLVVYAKQNTCSGPRYTTGWPRYAYAYHMLDNDDPYGLQRYSTLLHFFGVEKFKEFVKSDQENSWYPRATYGAPGAEMLRASRVFGRDLHYHWNYHHSSDEVLNSGEGDTFGELAKLNLKPFHPVTNIYAVGCVVDGKAIITARPYRIETFEQTIDFVSTMKQRPNKEWFGDFEYVSCQFERGRENAWKEQSKGVYTLTPKSSLLEVEEVNVTYKDKSTDENHVVICQFTQFYSSNAISSVTRIGGIPNSRDNLFDAYRYISQDLDENITSFEIEKYYSCNNGIANPEYRNNDVNTWLSIIEGKLTPPETATYIFSCTGEFQTAFYLSETQLNNDPDLDADALLNFQPSRNLNYATSNQSAPIELVAGKMYHFRHIVFPYRDSGNRYGRGWVGFKKASTTDSFQNVPQSWFKLNDKELTPEEKFNNQFKPDFERIYFMDKYEGMTFKNNARGVWDVYKVPRGECRINSNNHEGTYTDQLTATDVLTDGDSTTEYRIQWWPWGLDFPHIFEVDMGEPTSFNAIRIGRTGNPSFYSMNNYLNIYLAPYNYTLVQGNETIPYSSSNYSINHEESLIWSGYWNTATMDILELNKTYSGQYLKLEFLNNSVRWKDGNAGRTCISAIEVGEVIHAEKVYPMTNPKYIRRDRYWEEYRGGLYYNGKGFTGFGKKAVKSAKKNSILQIKLPKGRRELGIIGDYYPGMGRATVEIDGDQVGTIGDSLNQPYDNKKLLRAQRSYITLLFHTSNLNPKKTHNIVIEITSGKITFAGFLTDQVIVNYTTDDGSYEREYNSEKLPKFKNPDGLSGGAIAAIVIVTLLAVAGIAIGIFVMYKKQIGCFNGSFSFGRFGGGNSSLMTSFV